MALILELMRDSPRLVAMMVCLVSFALVLHGTLPAAEVTPRLDATYGVAGFADFIGRHGRTQPYVDARMSWPGMLAAAGMMAKAMHVPTLWFARWAPVFFNIAYLVPIKAIANVSLKSSRARWAALPIFLAANWIDQDYFSPQGIDLFLYLTVVAIAIRTFGAHGEQPRPLRWFMTKLPYRVASSRLPRLVGLPAGAAPGELTIDSTTAFQRGAFVGLALLLVAAMVVSHQFTPLASCVVLFALSLAGRTRLKSLWLFVIVLTFAWLSWEAEVYWAGHLSAIFGGVGHVTTSLGTSVTTRFNTVSAGRLDVQRARLLAAGVTWLGGMLGFFMLWRRGRPLWTLAIVMTAPVVVAVGVNYGGEVVLRILLFSLAPCSIFIAGLLDGVSVRWTGVAAFAIIATLLVALFPLTRYGNEIFDAMAPSDLAAASWIHSNVPAGSTVWVVNENHTLYSEGLGRYRYAILDTPPPVSVRAFNVVVKQVKRGSYIYLNRSQEEYGIVVQGGFPQHWIDHFADWLVSSGHAKIVHRTATAYVLKETESIP